MFKFKTLEELQSDVLLQAFNEAFADYQVPIRMTSAQLETKLKVEDYNAGYSVGAFVDGHLVGFIFHGVRTVEDGLQLYNGGTGVLPAFRGKGLTKAMYDYLLPKLKQLSIKKISLEVLAQNIPAIKSYEAEGFQVKRKVACYSGRVAINNQSNSVLLRPLASIDDIHLQDFWSILPTWQNEVQSIKNLGSGAGIFGAFEAERLLGYIAYNISNCRIMQIAVEPASRRQGIGKALVAAVVAQCGVNLSVINVDDTCNAVLTFFEEIGLRNTVKQLDMQLVL
jgi:GNAT superfamily N-acetyltransferase